ncbi:MAG: amidohydrolase family protein [Archangium sp.]|nr:amidohydrolase family protein [Archangium sp.]MDP3572220.1 amidohydrolase family protein [Archangium sp.]
MFLRLVPLLVLAGCATTPAAPKNPRLMTVNEPPRAAEAPPSKPAHAPTLIRNGTVLTAAGQVFVNGHVVLIDGRIAEVGEGAGSPPAGALIIDAKGGFITPGLIDTHSHVGVYAWPGTIGSEDGNEMTNPITAHVRSESAFWPQDPAIWHALSGGVTTIQILPGSGNVIGGRSFVAHLKPEGSARAMRYPGAPEGLKMACGENPKRYYGGLRREPMSRMGVVATLRSSLQRALEYRRGQQKWQRDLELWRAKHTAEEGKAPPPTAKPDGSPDDPPEGPARDFGLETLVEVLEGKLLVHHHCYRADEMHQVLDVAREYGYQVRSFHHAVEAYKLADRLAAENVSVSTWVDWWGFKMESLDGVPQNVALVQRAGGRPILHSDSAVEMRRLNQEAAKARAAGRRFGLEASDDQVLRWVTANPAWALGIEADVGTLEKGKRADVVVWNGNPFSVYSLAQQVLVDGSVVYDRAAHRVPISDFELGLVDEKELP